MKTTLLPEALRYDWIGPLAGLPAARAVSGAESVHWSGMAARLQIVMGNGVDGPRVAAVQEVIRTGRYVADTDEVAAGVLATIAPGRRH
jgi:anti-sigma28 factor (negative regulator of flagellin synthesis)